MLSNFILSTMVWKISLYFIIDYRFYKPDHTLLSDLLAIHPVA